MSKNRSRTAPREAVRPAALRTAYVVAGMLLFTVVAGAAAQLLWASATPESVAAPAVSTAPPTANDDMVSRAVGGDNSVQTLNLYGGGMRPLVEERGGVQTMNIYGPGGQIIAQVVRDGQGSQEVRYLLADHLGSTRVVLDADGTAIARYEYAPYGETTVAGTAGTEVAYRYTGHRYDEGQEVYETPNRVYHPAVGRFLSVDAQREDASPYVYAGNNPVGYVDPTGGGKVPFILIEPSVDRSSAPGIARSIVKLVGAAPGQVASVPASFSNHGRRRSQAFERPLDFIRGQGTVALERNGEFYWLMGGRGETQIPTDFIPAVQKLNAKQRGVAGKIVLLDFTGTGNGQRIKNNLEPSSIDSIVIAARVMSHERHNTGRLAATTFEIHGEVGIYSREAFRSYVRQRVSTRWPNPDSQGLPQLSSGFLDRELPPVTSPLPPGLEHEIFRTPSVPLTSPLSPGLEHEIFRFPSVPPPNLPISGYGEF